MNQAPSLKLIEEFEDFLKENGYKELCLIGGKVCGTHDYLTTRGIVVGLTAMSLERRYCFQDREEASRELAKWKAQTQPDDHPGGNWIKLKGRFNGEVVDYLNPNWSESP